MNDYSREQLPQPNSSSERGVWSAPVIVACGLLTVVAVAAVYTAVQARTTVRLAAESTETASRTLEVVQAAAAHAARPRTFEYAVASPSDYSWDREANEFGGAGWTIVSARRAVDSDTKVPSYELILMRETPGRATAGSDQPGQQAGP